MADRVNPVNYHNMIDALRTFATNTDKTCESLRAAAASCKQALGEGDVATGGIADGILPIVQKYESTAATARQLARIMEEELNRIIIEQINWENDSSGEDGDE